MLTLKMMGMFRVALIDLLRLVVILVPVIIDKADSDAIQGKATPTHDLHAPLQLSWLRVSGALDCQGLRLSERHP